MSVRRNLKLAAESVLTMAPVIGVARRRVSGRAVILAYHNIVPDDASGGGDRSLHLPLSTFAAQIDHVQRTHDVVPLADVLRAGSKRPRVTITFDDAYRGAVRVGLAELARRRLPATVFVTPGLLGGRAFWWDVLASSTDGLLPTVRDHALDVLQGKDDLVRGWAAERRLPMHTMPADYQTATEEELQTAVRSGDVQLGSHTWTHPALPALAPDELIVELERPLAWLRERFSSAAPWIAYPYGLSSPAVEAATKRAGYEAACMVAGGWMPPGSPNRFALPRQNIPRGLSDNGFALRLAGLFCE
jgi:peptidoglycan/xylan/chitin deacetylase (PgdA/CDA1 family)